MSTSFLPDSSILSRTEKKKKDEKTATSVLDLLCPQLSFSASLFFKFTCSSSTLPLCLQNFLQSQGRRVRLRPEFRGNLEDIFSDLSNPSKKGKVNPKSAAVADIVTVGDSWLKFAIKSDLIDPIQGVEDQDWFTGLSEKWKVRIHL